MEAPEKPKRSLPVVPIIVILIGLLLWKGAGIVPPLVWLKPPLTGLTILFNYALALAVPYFVLRYFKSGPAKNWHCAMTALLYLVTGLLLCWITLAGVITGITTPEGCITRNDGMQIECVMEWSDGYDRYTFVSHKYLPLIMVLIDVSPDIPPWVFD